MKLGPYIVLRIDEEPFYNHFKRFWATMPRDMQDAARLAAIHVKYRPGMRPQDPKQEPLHLDEVWPGEGKP